MWGFVVGERLDRVGKVLEDKARRSTGASRDDVVFRGLLDIGWGVNSEENMIFQPSDGRD